MQEYDRTSKWLIQHHGDSILRIAGVHNLVSWRPLQAELVQPRQLPDGLVEAQLAGEPQPALFVLELATYPDQRLLEQVLRDMTLVYLDRRVLPEVLVLVLHPKGNLIADAAHELHSPCGWTRLEASWRVVRLWTIAADELLAADDVGVIPWVPLSQISGPAEPVLQKCRERIDRDANEQNRENLLAVTQVLTRLRYNDPRLLAILGGQNAMIDSPLIQELISERAHKLIITVLETRFGPVPDDITALLATTIDDDARLNELARVAASCDDLDAFRAIASSRTGMVE